MPVNSRHFTIDRSMTVILLLTVFLCGFVTACGDIFLVLSPSFYINVNYNVILKTLLQEDLSESKFYCDLWELWARVGIPFS